MNDVFKSFQWYVVTLFIVGSFASIVAADTTGNYKWVAPIALSGVMAYVCWYFWCKDYDKPVMIVNSIVFIVSGIVSYFHAQDIVYVLTGQIYEFPAPLWWIILNAVVGIPAMVIALKTM